MNNSTHNDGTPDFGRYVGLLLLGLLIVVFVLPLVGCAVKYPIPPTGEQAGRYGYIEARVSYVPNLQTAIDYFTPNPVIPSTLNDK